MRAIRIHEDGGPEVLRLDEVEDPVAGPGEVLVRLRAASLNRLDCWIRQGLPSVPKPRILGADGAGVVEELGAAVEGLEQGQAVVLNPGLDDGAKIIGEHMDGTHAELIAVPQEYVHLLPEGLEFEEAAAFPLVYETAYRMLVTRAGLREDEWVLVWGVGSGVGSAALVIAKALGAKVVATSSDDAKLDRARDLGADVVVNHESGDVVAAVKEAAGGVDVVVEHVGEATWTTLAPGSEGRREDRRLRSDVRTKPTREPAPDLLEAALDPRLDDGDTRGLRSGLRARRLRSSPTGCRSGLPARGGGRSARVPGERAAVRQGDPHHSLAAAGFPGV